MKNIIKIIVLSLGTVILPFDILGMKKPKREIFFKDQVFRVICIECHPYKNLFVFGSALGMLRLHDLEGNEIAKFKGHKRTVRYVGFSPDGKEILSGSSIDKTINCCNLDRGLKCSIEGNTGRIAIHPEKFLFAFGASTNKILFVRQGKEVDSFKLSEKRLGQIIKFCPIKGGIVFLCKDGTIKSYFYDDGSCSKDTGFLNEDVFKQKISCFDFHRSGDWCIIARPSGRLLVYDFTKKRSYICLEQEEGVTCISVHRRKDQFVSGDTSGSIKLWNREGICLVAFEGHVSKVKCLDFCSNRNLFVSGSCLSEEGDSILKVWDTTLGDFFDLGKAISKKTTYFDTKVVCEQDNLYKEY